MNFTDNEILHITKCCKKKFHNICYNNCMQVKQECPLCRHSEQEHVVVIVHYENYKKYYISCTILMGIVIIIILNYSYYHLL